jgi:hypothetical protein
MEKINIFDFTNELSKEILYNWDYMIDWITKLMQCWDGGRDAKNLLFIAHLSFNRWYILTEIEWLIEWMKARLEDKFYANWDKMDFYFYTKIRNKKIEVWVENN